MKKILILVLLLSFCLTAEAADKLKIKKLHTDGYVSSAGVASKLISVTFHASNAVDELHIIDGTTNIIDLQTDHNEASFGPFSKDTAPVFNTDIYADFETSGWATFVYIELE